MLYSCYPADGKKGKRGQKGNKRGKRGKRENREKEGKHKEKEKKRGKGENGIHPGSIYTPVRPQKSFMKKGQFSIFSKTKKSSILYDKYYTIGGGGVPRFYPV